MATKKKPTKKPRPVPFGTSTPAGKFSLARRATMRLNTPRVDLDILGGDFPFKYTTPSVAHNPVEELEARGCRFSTSKNGARRLIAADRKRPECQRGPASTPCATSRKSCPVQLVFDGGKPALRFCFKKNGRGFAHRFENVDEAARFAEEACKCWSRTGSFDKCREFFSEGLIGVGGAKKRKKAPKRRDAIVVAAQRRKAGAHTDKRKRRGKQDRAWRDEE